MKTLLFLAFLVAASSVWAAPEETLATQREGVDLLTADYVHDAYGNVVVILPDTTPFDSDAGARKRYLDAYVSGFHSGYAGKLSIHDATSQPLLPGELEGWSAGQWTGYRSQQKEALHRPHP